MGMTFQEIGLASDKIAAQEQIINMQGRIIENQRKVNDRLTHQVDILRRLVANHEAKEKLYREIIQKFDPDFFKVTGIEL